MKNEKPLSLYWEIRTFFYAGVLSLVWGVGMVVHKYSIDIGITTLIAILSLAFIGCLIYCFSKAAPFSTSEVDSPTMGFDYVLYVGCALFSINLGLIEANYHLLKNQWDWYVLGSSLLFFVLAYRFDNRLVLSLALTTLAGWFGLQLKNIGWYRAEQYLAPAIVFGTLTIVSGFILARLNIKKHFLDVYANVGALTLLTALLVGSFDSQMKYVYFTGLLVLCAATIIYSLRERKFIYLVYAVVAGYIGISGKIVLKLNNVGVTFFYFILSSLGMVVFLYLQSRRFKDEK